MTLDKINEDVIGIIKNEFNVQIIDSNISLFSQCYDFSTTDVIYIIYCFLKKYNKNLCVKPDINSYSPNEISKWLLQNEAEANI